ncbi:MAG TPA: cell wall hydrolase, partial [Caulobacteraceae bacterium]|nr:cell wall hydrolase [Caulobacteraceae bacterium]
SPEQAQRINAYLPNVAGEAPLQTPFFLHARGPERDRALLCMTQAIYYEAALEPEAGQEAVAQTVINRLRHPAFPKSICGVVYQGAQQVTGCQFSFTCDGSRDRAPERGYWERAKAVAERALNGFVQRSVGTATYYHADYVFPRWGPTLVKIAQIGAHIFYRFPGPAGASESFGGQYSGGELRVSMAGPSREAILAAKAAAEAGLVPVSNFTIIDPTAPGGIRNRVAGQVVFGRRIPTKDEIAQINRSLAAFEAAGKPAPGGATPAPPAEAAAPGGASAGGGAAPPVLIPAAPGLSDKPPTVAP